MKSLLVYLCLVFGLELIFNINSKAASMTFHKYFCVNNPGENFYFSRVNKKEDCNGFAIIKKENKKLIKDIGWMTNKPLSELSRLGHPDKYNTFRIIDKRINRNQKKEFYNYILNKHSEFFGDEKETQIVKADSSQTQNKKFNNLKRIKDSYYEIYLVEKNKTRIKLLDRTGRESIGRGVSMSIADKQCKTLNSKNIAISLSNEKDLINNGIIREYKCHSSGTQIAKTEPSQKQEKVIDKAKKSKVVNKETSQTKKIVMKKDKKDDVSLWDKLKKGLNDTFNKNQKPKKKIQKLKPKKIEPKIVEKPKSPFELKVLAALKEEKKKKIKCEINEKPNILKGEKLNLCIKKSDIIKLGEYKQFNEYPKQMISKIKGCKTESCLGKEAGQRVYKTFVKRGERYHAKYPGEIIHGMAWFEILYLDKLKKTQKALQRYNNNKYDGFNALRKTTDKKQIYSLIKMNNSRIKMRNALGMTLYDGLQIVIKNQWLLGDFLNNDKLKVKKVKINPELKKRKLLLEKYKSTLARYKKKLEEKNIN